MEDELLQDKKLLRGIFDGIQDGISILDKNLNILHVNHVINKWYSHALPLTGKKCFQAYHNRSEPCEGCPTLRAIEKGILQMNVVSFEGPEGTIVSQERFAFPLKDEKDNVTGVIEYVRDITGKKKMEEEIDSTSKIIQLLPEIALATSEASTFDEAMQICIDRVCLHTGWDVGHVYLPDSKGSLFSSKLWFFRDPEQFETFRKITDKTVFTKGAGLIGKVFAKEKLLWLEDVNREPYFLRTKSGKDINVRFGFAFPVMVDKKTVAVLEFFAKKSLRPDGSFLEAISTISSHLAWVYERKKTQEAFLDYKQQIYMLSLATTNMLWNWDLINGTIKRNIGFEKAFGYTKEEIVPNIEWWIDRLHPDDRERVFSVYENTVKKGDSTCSYEYRFRHSDGNYSYISDNVYIVRDDNGKAIRSLGAMTDITKRKEAEEMQQKHNKVLQQKNIALTEVLGHIEFEKKEVKNNVLANAENLLLPIIEKIRLKGESRKYLELLKKGLKELTSSFGSKLTEKEAKLTSREIEICNMIKNGLASKEIADLLNISLPTTEKHRANIRKKLGITKKEVNLVSFLKTL